MGTASDDDRPRLCHGLLRALGGGLQLLNDQVVIDVQNVCQTPRPGCPLDGVAQLRHVGQDGVGRGDLLLDAAYVSGPELAPDQKLQILGRVFQQAAV